MSSKSGNQNDIKKIQMGRWGSRHASGKAHRTQLLKAAVRCFGALGYRATTIDMIAREAGLSIGTLNRIFKDKDELLLAMLDDSTAELTMCWANRHADEDLLHQLRDWGQATTNWMSGQRTMMPVWLEFFRNKTAREHLHMFYISARRRLAASIEAGMRDGKVNAASSQEVADTFLALLKGVAISAMIDPKFDASHRFADAWNVVEAGLRADFALN